MSVSPSSRVAGLKSTDDKSGNQKFGAFPG
jgi:hypothetical protein